MCTQADMNRSQLVTMNAHVVTLVWSRIQAGFDQCFFLTASHFNTTPGLKIRLLEIIGMQANSWPFQSVKPLYLLQMQITLEIGACTYMLRTLFPLPCVSFLQFHDCNTAGKKRGQRGHRANQTGASIAFFGSFCVLVFPLFYNHEAITSSVPCIF